MRLSDFKDEEAIDVLADLLSPAAIIMGDPEMEKIGNSGKPKLLMAQYALKAHKKEVIEVISILHRTPVKDLKFTVASLLKDLMDILNDPELQELFFSPGQMTDVASSGSVTGNTEA